MRETGGANSSEARQEDFAVCGAHPVRGAALSLHSRRSARNSPRHNPRRRPLDHSEGLANQTLKPAKSASREAFEEAGVVGKIGAKSVGLFRYDKLDDESGVRVSREVKVFPLMVKRQTETWPEFEQRTVQWVSPSQALSVIREPELKALVEAFAARARKRAAAAAAKPAPASPSKRASRVNPTRRRRRRRSGSA